MLELNKVMLIGNLTRDPADYLANGTALAKMGLAVNRSWKDKNSGQWQRDTTFIDLDAWGNQAEFCSKYLKKGKRIYVEGQLRLNSWEGSDGTKRSQIRVYVDRVQFADAPQRAGDDAAAGDGEPDGESTAAYPQGTQQRPAAQAPQAARPPFPQPGNGSAFGAEQPSGESTADDLPF